MAPLAGSLWFLAVALTWLHRQGEALGPPALHEIPDWLEAGGAEVAVVAILHRACMLVGWYLLATTAAAAVLGWLRVPRAVRAVEAFSPPPVRRLVRTVAGMAMTATATASMAASAGAHTFDDGAPPGAVTTAPPTGGSSEEVTMRRIIESRPEGQTVEMRLLPPEADDAVAPPTDGLRQRTIVAGDHFWSIAEEELAAARSRPVSDAEVDPYWRLLVDTNRPEVVDPDLLFPGQVVRIPPVPPEG